jgi:large conductance mechanosensitive channel
MKKLLGEFKDFIAGGNMIELAVAVILAGVVGKVIAAFIDGIMLKIVSAIVGKPDFHQVARIKIASGTDVVDPVTKVAVPGSGNTYLEFGDLITAIVTLIATGAVLFMIIKAYQKMKKPADGAPAGPSEVDLLTEIRDSLRART